MTTTAHSGKITCDPIALLPVPGTRRYSCRAQFTPTPA